MVFDSIPSLTSLDECIANPENPIGMRMRAAYYLRHIHSTTLDTTDQERVVKILEGHARPSPWLAVATRIRLCHGSNEGRTSK
jgi:hypothetical protein